MSRPIGSKNVFTASAKEAFRRAFEDMGGVKKLTEWAMNNQTDFYRLYSRLIPVEIAGTVKISKPAQEMSDDELAAIAATKRFPKTERMTIQ